MLTNTHAIKLDSNRLSCPIPSYHFRNEHVRLQMSKIMFVIFCFLKVIVIENERLFIMIEGCSIY